MARTILTLALALAIAGGISAQEAKKTDAEKAPPAQQQPQDPKKPAEIDRIDELRSQLDRARAELEATKAMVQKGGLPARVTPFLTRRELAPRVLDLGVEGLPAAGAPVAAAEPARKTGVRLLGDGEKERLGPDVIFTVDGEPVTKAEFDDTYAYLSSRPNSEDEQQNKREAIRALTIQKSALARFKGTAPAAREKMHVIEEMLAEGKDFADVARTNSQCPSSAQGGDLGFFGRGQMDPMFEKAAFETKVGETSGVVQSAFGYHLVKVTGEDKGENPRVRASHILVMFDDDQQAIRQAMMEAMNGRVDLAFADDEWRKLSPF